jgi:hypothetical protein
MRNPHTIWRLRSSTSLRLCLREIVPIFAMVVGVCGCGGGTTYSSSAPPSPTGIQNAIVSGQYNLALTSTNGHGKTAIYTNFVQTGTAFMGTADTLVCPSNDLSQCKGDDGSITPSGTIIGAKVTLLITLPNTAGADSVTLVGEVGTSLSGTYADSLGDTGTWTGSPAASLGGSYSGTFNSTSNPLPFDATIVVNLTQDGSFNLTGTAMITSSPCISSLNLSGKAIGQAFSLTDAVNKVHITAVPSGSNSTFSYNFDPTAPSCAGDVGRGQLTNPNPWDY